MDRAWRGRESNLQSAHASRLTNKQIAVSLSVTPHHCHSHQMHARVYHTWPANPLVNLGSAQVASHFTDGVGGGEFAIDRCVRVITDGSKKNGKEKIIGQASAT